MTLDVDGATKGTTPVTIGEHDGSEFKPYVDGQTVDVVLGFQGGYMITPSIRIELLADDPATICLVVAAVHSIDGDGAISPGFGGRMQFTRDGDAAYTEPFFDLLSHRDNLSGRNLTISLSVDENGTAVTDKKTILLH